MKKRVVRKSKPLFKKRRTPARTALNIVLTVLLLVGLGLPAVWLAMFATAARLRPRTGRPRKR